MFYLTKNNMNYDKNKKIILFLGMFLISSQKGFSENGPSGDKWKNFEEFQTNWTDHPNPYPSNSLDIEKFATNIRYENRKEKKTKTETFLSNFGADTSPRRLNTLYSVLKTLSDVLNVYRINEEEKFRLVKKIFTKLSSYVKENKDSFLKSVSENKENICSKIENKKLEKNEKEQFLERCAYLVEGVLKKTDSANAKNDNAKNKSNISKEKDPFKAIILEIQNIFNNIDEKKKQIKNFDIEKSNLRKNNLNNGGAVNKNTQEAKEMIDGMKQPKNVTLPDQTRKNSLNVSIATSDSSAHPSGGSVTNSQLANANNAKKNAVAPHLQNVPSDEITDSVSVQTPSQKIVDSTASNEKIKNQFNETGADPRVSNNDNDFEIVNLQETKENLKKINQDLTEISSIVDSKETNGSKIQTNSSSPKGFFNKLMFWRK